MYPRSYHPSHKHPVRLTLALDHYLVPRMSEILHRDNMSPLAYRIHTGFGCDNLEICAGYPKGYTCFWQVVDLRRILATGCHSFLGEPFYNLVHDGSISAVIDYLG